MKPTRKTTMKIKNLICTISLLFASCVSAYQPDWATHHQEALKVLHQSPIEAYARLCDAINSLQDPKDPSTLFLFVERGSILLDMDRKEEAITDFNYVLSTLLPDGQPFEKAKDLPTEQRILFCNALSYRTKYWAIVGDQEKCVSESRILSDVDPRVSDFEMVGDDLMISKSFPSENFADLKRMFVKSGLVEKGDDVQLSPTGVLTIKLIPCGKCCDSCEDGKECDGKKKLEKAPRGSDPG